MQESLSFNQDSKNLDTNWSNLEDSILDKFDSVEVDNNSRLSSEDADFCMKQQTLYEQVLAHYTEMYTRLTDLKQFDSNFYSAVAEDNIYCSYDYKYQIYCHDFFKFDEDDFLKLIMLAHNNFIKQINTYFREKYTISIPDNDAKSYFGFQEPTEPRPSYGYYRESEEEIKTYETAYENYEESYRIYRTKVVGTKLHYDCIVDDIFLLLGACSFEEQADKEIKDNVREAVRNFSGTFGYLVKSKKITFSILYSYKCSIFKRYEIDLDRSGYKALLRALAYFDSDKSNTSIYASWVSNFTGYKKTEDDGIYGIHPVYGHKIVSFKFFKNGKFEVEFIDHKTALEFANEFLGYREG